MRIRPFGDKQIALLENFAARAVIAMENARLLTEMREALEQQSATAEVLQVINSSPGDLIGVFDAILEKAHILCAVSHGGPALYDTGTFRYGASRGYPQTLVERLRQGYRPHPGHPIWGLLEGEPYVHIPDLAEIDDPTAKAVVELAGIRTTLFVALRRDTTLLGMITAARDRVDPFGEKEIALLENFAAQAVIAMENRVTADCGVTPDWSSLLRTLLFRPGRETVTGRTLLERQVVQIADITADPEYALPGATTVGNIRTVVGVPLLREGDPIGVMQLVRSRVEPFTARQIELVRTFADQAVIAIESTRLLTELRESLEQQHAIAEVLQVINSSPGDLAPVFEAMVEKARRLCLTCHSYGELPSGKHFDDRLMRSVSAREPDALY